MPQRQRPAAPRHVLGIAGDGNITPILSILKTISWLASRTVA